MRILHVNKLYYPWIGGVEDIVKDVVSALSKGHHNEILVCQPKGRRAVDRVNGITVTRAASWGIILGMPISWDFFKLFSTKAQEADLIFLHHPFPLGFLAWALFSREKPVVVWYHSDIIRQRLSGMLFRPVLRFVLRRARYIFVSNDNLVRHSVVLKRYSERCLVVPFGVDPSDFKLRADSEKVLNTIRKKFNVPLVLSVGRLVYYKGFSYLIEAMRRLDGHLLIIGAGPLKEKLMKTARSLGISDKVSIISPVDDLTPFYHACDVFVLPSVESTEAFGIVQLQAMACGKPVVNTDLPTGVPTVSIHGVTGFTVPPKDAKALAGAIRELLTNRREREKFGKQAKERVKKEFTKTRFTSRLREVIESITV